MRVCLFPPLAERAQEQPLRELRARGCAGESICLGFGLLSERPRRVEVRLRGLEGQAWLVKHWEQPGLGLYRGERRRFAELLLKDDVESFGDGYRDGVYQPPALRLSGPPRFWVVPGEARQVWLSLRLARFSGVAEVDVVDANTGELLERLPVHLEILPLVLVEPWQDRMLWYRGTLDPGNAQHFVSAARMEAQLRDIRAHGFCSLTIWERTRAQAQRVIDLARKVGFERHLVLMAPYPKGLLPLRWRGLTPVFYVSDELDGHGPEVARAHEANLVQARGKTMASLLSPLSLADLPGRRPDLISCAITSGAVWLHALSHFPESYGRPIYYYWPCHLEKPALQRLLAGVALWRSRADGISPYCYQHLPVSPSSPFRDEEEWEPDFRLGGKSHPFRQHMTTYPARDGEVTTVQWEGLGQGIWDLRYLATWERRLERLAPEQARRLRKGLDRLLEDFDLRRLHPSDQQRDPWPGFDPDWLDRVREHVIDDLLRLG